MKKIFILVLMGLVGISLLFSNLKADEARTIPMKSGVAVGARIIIVAHGGTLYKVTGYANSANATYAIHDATNFSVTGTSGACEDDNTLVEGGEATQYDSFTTIDFGEEGIEFNTGLAVITSTAYVSVLYR